MRVCPQPGHRPVHRPLSPVNALAAWSAGLLLFALAQTPVEAASSPHRGLWVGQVTVNFVNEVPVPLDEKNVPIAPDPKVPTPTTDQAHLRLILHVDGAGMVSLLRDVAVIVRAPASSSSGPLNLSQNPGALAYQSQFSARESDMALVTDERMYGAFPAQPAYRIASAVFDFGDGRATEAVQAVVSAAAAAAAQSVLAFPGDVAKAETAAKAAANGVIQHSDVATEFSQFLSDNLRRPVVDDLAAGNAGALTAARAAAAALAAWSSFFPDLRGSNMVEAIHLASLTPGTTADQKRKLAQNTAAAHADLASDYARFLAGKEFGDMIAGASAAAGTAAVANGATAGTIALAVKADASVRAAQSTALSISTLSQYADTRAPDAVNLVVEAIVASAASLLPAATGTEKVVTAAATDAGRRALSETVNRYPVPAVGPTPDYTAFVKSADFTGSSQVAAAAAAQAAVAALAGNPFLTLAEIKVVAADAATDALRVGSPNAFNSASLAVRRELPLTGVFGPGMGDARFSHAIKTGQLAPLGSPALVGTIFLPASHPTNPFRHRRHPDHRYGFDVTRNIRLDFDAKPAGPIEPPGYGVNRITGIYREELFGLHKPLGPDKDVGLRVEGRFELNRISHIDALNAH